ncbi:hypothetical protein BC827DRAFT_1240516 [Russula dissimulans]|nr:hypothetical protein BC827DRAFT_1240516 [Russula dissimulans]
MMLQTPALITLSIAATRMYRSLIDFGSRDITISTQKRSGLTASDGNRTCVGPIQFNQMSVSIDEDGEQNAVKWEDHRGSCDITDRPRGDTPQGLGVEDGVESGETWTAVESVPP